MRDRMSQGRYSPTATSVIHVLSVNPVVESVIITGSPTELTVSFIVCLEVTTRSGVKVKKTRMRREAILELAIMGELAKRISSKLLSSYIYDASSSSWTLTMTE